MTDSINSDTSYSVMFNFFLDPAVNHSSPKTESVQVNMDGRSWEIHSSDYLPSKKKQVVFTAKSGSLFR